MKKTLFATAALLLAASLAPAAIVINAVDAPASAAATVVTGSGAPANGAVELLVNGASAGSVAADGSGNWTITADIAANDVLTAQNAQVWNFNTDGDLEGWTTVDGTTAVSGGVLTITEGGTDNNCTVHYTGQTIIQPNLPVMEICYKTNTASITSAIALSMTAADASGNTSFFGPNIGSLVPSANFTSALVDMTVWNADYTVAGGAVTGGPDHQIGFGFAGISDGELFEIDYIRMRETYKFEFAAEGDVQGFGSIAGSPGFNTTVTSTGGQLITTADEANTNVSMVQTIFQEVNPALFTVVNFAMTLTGTNGGQLAKYQFLHNSGSGYTTPGELTMGYTPDYGNAQVVTGDLTGSAEWSAALVCALNGSISMTMFAPVAGENAAVDSIELAPAGALGVADAVTVGLDTAVSDWMMMD